jgi:hypothetical protein
MSPAKRCTLFLSANEVPGFRICGQQVEGSKQVLQLKPTLKSSSSVQHDKAWQWAMG